MVGSFDLKNFKMTSLPVSTGNTAAEGLGGVSHPYSCTGTPPCTPLFKYRSHDISPSASSQTFTVKLQQEGTHPGPPRYLYPPGPPLRSRWECFQVEVQEGGSLRLSALCRRSQTWAGLREWGEGLQKRPTEKTVYQAAVIVTRFLRLCFLTASGGKMASLASSIW